MPLVQKLQQTLFRRRGVQSVESFELLINEYLLSLLWSCSDHAMGTKVWVHPI
jgi:hypothetical protein